MYFYLFIIPIIRCLLSFIFIFTGKKYNVGFKPKNLKKKGKFKNSKKELFFEFQILNFQILVDRIINISSFFSPISF